MEFKSFIVLKEDHFCKQFNQSPSNPSYTILGWTSREKSGGKIYAFQCKICLKDKELHHFGVYFTSKGSLTKLRRPCGCSLTPNWTPRQHLILLNRKMQSLGYKILDIGEWKKSHTLISYSCIQDHTNQAPLYQAKRLKSCNLCKIKKVLPITTQHGIEVVGQNGHILSYVCDVCSVDEYVKNEVCNGVFSISKYLFKLGKRSCRCSKAYRWNVEEREFQVREYLKRRNLPYVFMGWSKGYKNNRSKLKFKCPVHGIQLKPFDKFLSGAGCSLCHHGTTNIGYVMLIQDKDLTIGLKYGVTSNSQKRLSQLNARNKFKSLLLCQWVFPDSFSCLKAEKAVKYALKEPFLSKIDFPDGYTETCEIQHFKSISKIFESHGGSPN